MFVAESSDGTPGNAASAGDEGSRPWRFAVALVVVAAASSWVLFSGAKRAAFHGDESGWISSGIYYTGLLAAGDFARTKWDCRACASWGALNGQLGKLLIGVSYATCDPEDPCAFNAYYDFAASRDENQRRGNIPPEDILVRGRYSAVTAGVICCLLAFAVGYLVSELSLVAGFLSAGLVLSSALFQLSVSRAMTDAFYNVFLVAQVLVALAIVKFGHRHNIASLSLLAGVIVGLTASAKVSGYVLGLPLFLLVLGYRFSSGGRQNLLANARAILISIGAFITASLITVYALNPTFWPSGVSDIRRILRFPASVFAWDRYMASQAAAGLGRWEGNHLVDIHQSLFLTHSRLDLDILFVVGVAWCARRCLASLRRGVVDPAFVPLVFFLLNYFLVVGFLRLNWDRYYLPTEIAMRVIAAIGVAGIASTIFGRGPTSPSPSAAAISAQSASNRPDRSSPSA